MELSAPDVTLLLGGLLAARRWRRTGGYTLMVLKYK